MNTTVPHLSKRCNIDFSKHELVVRQTEELLIHILGIPGSSFYRTKFINTNGILAVTGDFGNWIFCREFHPDPKGSVSDGYWREKLQISSCQEPSKYDAERTEQEIKERLADEDTSEEEKEYLKDILRHVDNELDYSYHAYRHEYSMDYEYIPFVKSVSTSLLCVFDAFEEICRRLAIDSTTINISK